MFLMSDFAAATISAFSASVSSYACSVMYSPRSGWSGFKPKLRELIHDSAISGRTQPAWRGSPPLLRKSSFASKMRSQNESSSCMDLMS